MIRQMMLELKAHAERDGAGLLIALVPAAEDADLVERYRQGSQEIGAEAPAEPVTRVLH